MHYYGRALEVEKQNAPRPETGTAVYKVPGQQAYYAIDKDGNIFDFGAAVPGGGSGLLSFQVPIPSAQVLTLNSNPVEVIPAPDANSFIQLIDWGVKADGGTPYDTNTGLQLEFDSITSGVPVGTNTAILQSTVETIQNCTIINFQTVDNNNTIKGEALKASVVNGDPANGDFDITIYGIYRIVTL